MFNLRTGVVILCVLVISIYSNDLCKGKCICNTKVLKCTGLLQTDIQSDAFENTLTAGLERIHITDGTIKDLPKNILGRCADDRSYKLYNLTKLDLQNNDIHSINGQTIHCMPNLEELNLANNQWNISREHSHVFTSVPNLKKLNLSNAFHNQVDGKIHMTSLQLIFLENDLKKLEVLSLDSNKFSVFDKDSANAICTMPNLKKLNLANNLLPKITLFPVRCSPKLEKLDLSFNSFITFEHQGGTGLLHALDMIQGTSSDLTVNLLGNEFDCDCGLAEFHNWMKRTKVHVLRRKELICHDGPHFNQSVLSLQTNDFKCLSINSSASSNNAVVGVLVTMFVLVALILIVVAYFKRESIKHFVTSFRKQSLAREHLVGYSSVKNENCTDIEV